MFFSGCVAFNWKRKSWAGKNSWWRAQVHGIVSKTEDVTRGCKGCEILQTFGKPSQVCDVSDEGIIQIYLNHIFISVVSEHVKELMEKVCTRLQQHPPTKQLQQLLLAKSLLPCQPARNRLVRMERCAVMLQDSTPPPYFDELPSCCLSTQNNQTHWCLRIFIQN